MIPRHLEFTLERLGPLIARHHLVAVDHTAAALHGLTVRDVDTLELATAGPLGPRQTGDLGLDLHDHIRTLQPALATLNPAGLAAVPVRLHTGDGYAAVTVRAASPLGASDNQRELLAVSVATVAPSLQPIHDPCLTAVSRGGIRVPNLDQAAVARQALHAWLARPHDTVTCVELGLAVDRVGPDLLWTDRNTRHNRRPTVQLATILAVEAPQRLDAGGIPPRLADRARHGLAALHTLLAGRQHTQAPARRAVS